MNNKKSTSFIILGASNHSDKEREQNDFYATDPHALDIFLNKLDQDNIKLHENIWECACGTGHLSEVLKKDNIMFIVQILLIEDMELEILIF